MEYFNLQELGLPEDIWAPFARRHHATWYPPRHMIYFQDSRAECFYYLKSGRVKTFISSDDGGEKVLTIYQGGNLFGEASFFDELPRVSSAITLSPCEIVRIDRRMAAEELAQNPELTLALLKYLARTVRLLSGHVDDMAFLRADQRIARLLLSYGAQTDAVRCTQDEIAAAVSASRVTVCRVLKRFQEDGLVATGYGCIRLLDREGLQRQIGAQQ